MNRNENSLSCETKSNNIIKFIQSHKSLSLLLPFPQPLSHPLFPFFSEFFPPSIPFLLSLPLPWPFSQGKLIFSTILSFLQTSLSPFQFSHGYLISLPPSPPHSHMASWFSQDIADSSSSSDSLLEGGDEAHEQCVTAWLHEHRPVVHLHSLHLLTLYTISCTHIPKQNMYMSYALLVSLQIWNVDISDFHQHKYLCTQKVTCS